MGGDVMTAEDKLIEDIKRDREAGTPGPWYYANPPSLNGVAHVVQCRLEEFMVCECYDGDDAKDEVNARRIARVPDMEARILADAEEIKRLREDARNNAMDHLVLMGHADELMMEIKRLREALEECEVEIDGYVRQEYPFDHPVHESRRQRDFAANPARIALENYRAAIKEATK